MGAPPPAPYRVAQLFAFLAEDANGQEGLIAMPMLDGTIMPLCGADLTRVEALRPVAEHIGRVRGCRVTLALFGQREDREVLNPDAGRDLRAGAVDGGVM